MRKDSILLGGFETKEEIPREFSHLLIQAQQKLKFMNSTYLDYLKDNVYSFKGEREMEHGN